MQTQARGARACSRGVVASMVLGLTPMIAAAAPPGIDAAPSESEPVAAPLVERPGTLRVVSSAVSIVMAATRLDREQPPIDLGVRPIAVELPAGRYRIEAEGPGYRPWAREIEIRPGETLELQVEPELVEGARLELRASDEDSEGATVLLDGATLCELPCSETLEPGVYALEIRKRRHKRLSFTLELAQADEVVIDVALEPATSRAPAIVTGAVALTSLTMAVVFTLRADRTRRSLAADLDALEQFDADDRRIENGRRDAVIATSMYAVTSAVGLLTLYYLLRQSGPPSRADKRQRSLARVRWQLVPQLGPSGAGVLGGLEF